MKSETTIWPHPAAHPDSAWSLEYIGPRGLAGESCRHSYQRMGIGPYPGGRHKRFMFTADVCGWCGHILRSVRDISWQEYFWARRANATKDAYHAAH